MFRRSHDQALAEIRTLSSELGRDTQEILERIREARNELVAGEPLIAFVHIPKTAGGTVKSMFAAAYSRAAVHDAGNYLRSPEGAEAKLAGRRIERARVTIGHVPYGLLREHLPTDTRYLTFLREPVDRVLSLYHRHIRLRGDFSDELRPVVTDSVDEALEMGLPELNNLATRFLCGQPSPFGDLPSGALHDAKANLRDFAFVGIQERFDESAVLLQRMFGLGNAPYEARHLASDRPSVEEIPDEQRTLIEEYNQLDAELYAFAEALFDDAAAAAGGGLAADAEMLRDSSAAANRAALEDARDWLDRELPVGTTKPLAKLREAAAVAGISFIAVRYASWLLAVQRDRDEDGQIWSRTKEARVDPPGGRLAELVDPLQRDR